MDSVTVNHSRFFIRLVQHTICWLAEIGANSLPSNFLHFPKKLRSFKRATPLCLTCGLTVTPALYERGEAPA